MGVLHDEFMKIVGSTWDESYTRREVLRIILKKHDVELSDEQLHSLSQKIESGAESIVFPEDSSSDEEISIDGNALDEAASEFGNNIGCMIEKTYEDIVEQTAPRMMKSLYNSLPAGLKSQGRDRRSFEKNLHSRWKSGLNRLEMLISISHEAGESYSEDLNKESMKELVVQDASKIDVLRGLHCRSCRVAREILCLLKSGFAEGALARWRSLHELAVTSIFLVENSPELASQYLDHAAVGRWRAAREYQKHCEALGFEPFTDQELSDIRSEHEAMILKYGESFGDDYGWAANIVGSKRVNFSDIERLVQLSHWRPHFRFACQGVHAGSSSLFQPLGVRANDSETLLAGASDLGLEDPGHLTAISLTMATIAFLSIAPTLDAAVACRCMITLRDDTVDAFHEVGEEMEKAFESEDEE